MDIAQLFGSFAQDRHQAQKSVLSAETSYMRTHVQLSIHQTHRALYRFKSASLGIINVAAIKTTVRTARTMPIFFHLVLFTHHPEFDE